MINKDCVKFCQNLYFLWIYSNNTYLKGQGHLQVEVICRSKSKLLKVKLKEKECSYLISRVLRLQLKSLFYLQIISMLQNALIWWKRQFQKQQIFHYVSLLAVYKRQIGLNWSICMDIDKDSGCFLSRINSFVPKKRDWWFYYCRWLFSNCLDYSVRTCC